MTHKMHVGEVCDHCRSKSTDTWPFIYLRHSSKRVFCSLVCVRAYLDANPGLDPYTRIALECWLSSGSTVDVRLSREDAERIHAMIRARLHDADGNEQPRKAHHVRAETAFSAALKVPPIGEP